MKSDPLFQAKRTISPRSGDDGSSANKFGGDAEEAEALVCKTSLSGFESRRHLHLFPFVSSGAVSFVSRLAQKVVVVGVDERRPLSGSICLY
jgi:hypothetical protein